MESKKIYIIRKYSYHTKTEDLLGTAYKDLNNAKEYCLSQLNEEERENTRKRKSRGLITDYEFCAERYLYTVSEIDLL